MKELDIMLERYARSAHGQASPAERRVFAALLELPDPQLADYLFGHDIPQDPDLARLVRRIGCGAFATGGGFEAQP
jgi:succinate dehydrogenase flavin-adding protein (antitoxin of CptAB toxin-antitoxin module)